MTATIEGVSGSTTLTITPPGVNSVVVTPSAATIFTGATTAFAAVAKDAQGNTLTGHTITWASSAPSVATVDQAGVVTPLVPGNVNILATSEGRVGFAAVTVKGWLYRSVPDPLGQFPTLIMSVKAEADGTNGSAGGSAATLALACVGGATRTFVILVTTGGPITNNGDVRYRLDQGSTISETWLEVGSNFDGLGYPGTSAAARGLALTWNGGAVLLFEYTEFLGPLRVAKFLLNNMNSFLPGIVAQCP
ncbi:MAG TPA: Ig-like domain-containing protein [Gemmatimonadales bacterium]|nr:Ig-like domain-containing protein [Gemmatimonadales bacterium]